MTLLSVAVLSVALAAAPQTPAGRADAERLAQAGQYADALKQFQALAAANPDDIDARMWIARLHALMGHPARAVDVYQSIVATQPENVDALIGLGTTLTTLGRLREAGDALNHAESLAPDRPAVLGAQGRLHGAAGRSALALAYYERALAIEPGNEAARAARDGLRAARAHRVQGTYYFEHFSTDLPDTQSGTLEVNGRVSDSLRVFAAGQHERKFARDEDRAGGGIEWSPQRNLQIVGGAFFGSGTVVLPDRDVFFDARYAAGRIAWLGGVRYLHFDASVSRILSPGASFSVDDRLDLTLRYHHSQTDVDTARAGAGNDGCSVRASEQVGKRLWLRAGYIRGFEGLENVTAERLSQLDANTVSAGFEFTPVPMTSFGATYEHQWRNGGTRVSAVFVTVTRRF